MAIPSTPLSSLTIDLPSGPLTYCDIGDSGPMILLLHGLSFRPGLYPLIEQLRPHFRVIALDLPFTRQNHDPSDPTPQRYVDRILEFLAALRLCKTAIFGNSLGGTLGLLCALRHPDIFSHLILRAPLWTRAQFPTYLRIKPLNAAHRWLSRLEPYANFALDTIYALSEKMSPQDENAQAPISHRELFAQYQVNPTVLSAFLGNLLLVDLRDQLHRISNPTLVLWGQRDTLTPSIWGARLSRRLPDARFLEITAEYHNMATTDPQALADHITTFVRI